MVLRKDERWGEKVRERERVRERLIRRQMHLQIDAESLRGKDRESEKKIEIETRDRERALRNMRGTHSLRVTIEL